MSFEAFGVIGIVWLSLTIILCNWFYHKGMAKQKLYKELELSNYRRYYKSEAEEVKEMKMIRSVLLEKIKELQSKLKVYQAKS